jgi:hypothetical protein
MSLDVILGEQPQPESCEYVVKTNNFNSNLEDGGGGGEDYETAVLLMTFSTEKKHKLYNNCNDKKPWLSNFLVCFILSVC